MASDQEIDWILSTIRKRESGGNYTVKNRYSSASGAYQYIDSTWKGWLKRYNPALVDQYPTAASAPGYIQDAVARMNVESILDSSGGRVDAVPRAWYTGNPNAPDTMQPGGAGNEGTTVGRYVNAWMGTYSQVSGTEAGGGGDSVSAADATSGATVDDPKQYAMEHYGYMAAFLDNPEVGPILLQAAAEQWSEARLQGAITATQWWQTTNATARQWTALESQDPATAQSQINAQTQAILARANQLGLPTTQARASVIARDALRWGWQGAELDRAIGMDAGQAQLVESSFGTSLRATAKQFGVPLSDAALGDWAHRIASGEDTEENFQTYMRTQAMNMYPTIAGYLQTGGTTATYFDPYRQVAAQTLNVSPDSIDLSDPKWGAALSTPSSDGTRQALSMDDWQKMLKSDDRYGYRYTENANNEAEDFVGRIKRMMGVSA